MKMSEETTHVPVAAGKNTKNAAVQILKIFAYCKIYIVE